MRLERSRHADRDLAEILEYSVATWGERIAVEYVLSFDTAFAALQRSPLRGAALDSFDPEIRKLAHRRHRIFYELQQHRIFVLRILHQKMDPTRHLRQL